MKIAYQHLLRFLPNKPSINDLSNRLFQLGHEHEIEDSIFDMEFTPNRGDCLSLIGLTRDLNVFYDINVNLPIYNKEIPILELNFINKATNKCPNISFLNIQIDGETNQYKDYLEDYFIDLKIKKKNFFTDISNYLAYEMGQPTHSYDYSLIKKDITLEETKKNLKFETLLGKTIDLSPNELVFTSNEDVINLAGIVGGMRTCCSKDTKNALVECAFFMPESIIGKATKYDLNSDASHKFERSVDPLCHDKVLKRFIQIVADHASIVKVEIFTDTIKNFKERELEFNLSKVNSILGINETKDNYTSFLLKLGFEIDKAIKVPSYRSDVSTQNDLAEELARVIGYDNIPIQPISIPKNTKVINNLIEEEVKLFLINNGFSEVINSPFCNYKTKCSIEVDNPLDSNRKYIRSNLTNSLLENLLYNEKRQKDSIKLFEISDLYTYDNEVKSIKKLAIIISGRRGHNHIDFAQSLNKKYLINLFNQIDIDIEKEITLIDRASLDSKIKTPIFSIEILLDQFKNKLNMNSASFQLENNFVQYKPISEFPSSYRDFSFSIKDSSKINELIKQLDNSSVDNLKESFMFDLYNNTKINETKLGYRFIFQSFTKTLTDKEINASINKILDSILKIESVSLPGRD